MRSCHASETGDVHWAALLGEAKQRWSEDMNPEQARLLAAYYHVGSVRVRRWVKEIYTYMERCARQKIMLMLALNWIMTRMYRGSGLWAPERRIFWEIGSATEDSSESDESVDRSDSDELDRIVSVWSANVSCK